MSTKTHLIGHRFSGGSVEVQAHMSRLWTEAADFPPDPDSIHPSYVPLLALDGINTTVREIFTVLGTSPEEGGLAGGLSLELLGPVEIGKTYLVEGEFTAAEQKRGRRKGIFHLVTLVMSMLTVDTESVVSRTSIVWVVPEEEGSGAVDS